MTNRKIYLALFKAKAEEILSLSSDFELIDKIVVSCIKKLVSGFKAKGPNGLRLTDCILTIEEYLDMLRTKSNKENFLFVYFKMTELHALAKLLYKLTI
jgi:hypothetical protein